MQALLEAQQDLRQQVADSDVDRRHPKRAKNARRYLPPIQPPPSDAGANAHRSL